MNITFTLAICTFGRSEQVLRCLDFSQSELYGFDELILIDNNPTMDTSFHKNFILNNFKIFHEPKVGLSSARNRALQEASSRYVWFIDDDASLVQGFSKILESKAALWSAMNNPPSYGGGLILPAFQNPNSARSLGALEMALLSCNEKETSSFRPWGANMFVDRVLAISLGAFRENFGYVGHRTSTLGEEDDLFLRIMVVDKRECCFIKGASVFHWIPDSRLRLSWILRRALNGGSSNYLVYQKISFLGFLRGATILFFKSPREGVLTIVFEIGKLKAKLWQLNHD